MNTTISLLHHAQLEAALALFTAQLTEHALPTDTAGIRSVITQHLADDRHGFILAATQPDGAVVGIALACARSWRALDLEVTADHQRVISLYQRHGFQPHTRTRFVLKL